ncbi:hypothetical protein HGRIS_011055 [Hohenbuehelia grisea]
MGCATKNAKVVAISLGSLQRLIVLKAVPQSAVPVIIRTMGDAMNQGVDIQLRILQTMVSLLTNFPDIHGELLGDALLLCFKLHESKIAVVSSTAAATLRQLVMFIVDKMVDESKRTDNDDELKTQIHLPTGMRIMLDPCARDAYSVFEDLCLLANSEKPNFLKLESLHKTFALELIESVLTNYHSAIRQHPEMILLLQHHLCPLLLKALSDRPIFPLILRCTRVVFLLLKQFLNELPTEAEVFLTFLIRVVAEDLDSGAEQHSSHVQRPSWMRVLAMEVMRGLCSDAELVRSIWDHYDGREQGSKVFTSMITALKRLVTEKPALLGIASQMFGVGVDASGSAPNSMLDVTGMAGMMATAASATMSNVVGMMGNSGGLSVQSAAMKIQCIDQLDKADSPPIPDTYIYLLGVQCFVSLSEGFASFTTPLYNSIVVQRPRSAGDAVIRAPPALDFATLPQDQASTAQLQIVRDIIDAGWPALLAALSFVITTNLSDELFVDVLTSYQALTNVAGMLGLVTPRDAFITSLAKYAIPGRVVSSLESYSEPLSPRSGASFSENLGLSGPTHAPGLSERNLACLKTLIGSAMYLAGSLGESWYGVLEALQNADYVLTSKGAQATPVKKPTGGNSSSSSSRPVSMLGSPSAAPVPVAKHPFFADLDPEALHASIQRLFDASKNLEDGAFTHFIRALCKLSGEMVGMQSDVGNESTEDFNASTSSLSPHLDPSHRRRVSGIHIPRTLRSGDFGISKLGGVAILNIHRLIYRAPDVAWDAITFHLLSIIGLASGPSTIRLQAARVLDDVLIIVPRNLSSTGDLRGQVQRRVIDVLAKQIIPDNPNTSTTSVELRRMGLETLHQILQASGHTLIVGWETIFEMLSSVCRAPQGGADFELSAPSSPVAPRVRISTSLGHPSDKSAASLIKIAFQSLTLVCDSVSALSPEHLRLCITTLGHFGRQADTNIALTAAASLLWSVSDAIQAKRKDAEKEPEYSQLWLLLLLEILALCADQRQEVRDGAIQTLFRALQFYGATLSLDTWESCIWKVTFPLLDTLTHEMRTRESQTGVMETQMPGTALEQSWNDSKILAFHSIGSVFHGFVTTKLAHLESFSKAWDTLVGHVQDAVLHDNRMVSAPALRCLERAIKASQGVEPKLRSKVGDLCERSWSSFDEIGTAMLQKVSTGAMSPLTPMPQRPPHRFTQESLIAYLEVIQRTRSVAKEISGSEWSLDRLTRLMVILKGVLTYPGSSDYRPDIDSLPPLQASVMDMINGIDLSQAGVPSLVMSDLAEYATLAFLAAFDIPPNPNVQAGPKRITYIALAKRVMPLLVELYLRFKDRLEIYTDGTVETILSAYSIPIKMKYDCPAPSKFGKDLPLWKTATTNFLSIVKESTSQLDAFGKDISDERAEGIWRQVIDVFRGGILADCSAVESFPLEVQESEENFDLALIASLEIDVLPHFGDPRVPDDLIRQLANVLCKGSCLYELDSGDSRPGSPGKDSAQNSFDLSQNGLGSTDFGLALPRERFSYWCLDLLFLMCSDNCKDQEGPRRRLAALALPSLLSRCRSTMVGYVADEALRGSLPFPRAREEELLYVLRKLHDLVLWSGSIWASLTEEPSKYCIEQTPIDHTLGPSALVADAVKRSTLAHLYHFYPVLCEIASIPRKTPSTWMAPPKSSAPAKSKSTKKAANRASGLPGHVNGNVVELDARVLARQCLQAIGKELGVSHL